ncbi:site-specific integrase [Actinoplanes sp. NPDC051475]|uniref:tyrosine-type recombinase/integrase n=1 Tax=Actinoplanes sp. NPDC051475 TaxID=3157225 RepID=UPI00344B89F3
MHRIRATLRAALNAAIRDGLITDNPARRVELPTSRRPHALVWTEHRVAQWRSDGQRPPVAVWTPSQLAEFLEFAADDPLYPLWWLIALRGLRRGEAAGLRWHDIDLDRRHLVIVSQRTTVGYRVVEGPPKSAASRRTVALDPHTVSLLRRYQQDQRRRATAAGRVWRPDGYVFTDPDGHPYHPNVFTRRLQHLIAAAGLPPVRLHDLRHGAASLAHTAGADLKTVQDQLGHASIVLTADTYTSVLPATQHKAAANTARLVLAAARAARRKMIGRHRGALLHPRSNPQPPTRPSTTERQVTPTRRSGKKLRKQRHPGASSGHPPSTIDSQNGQTCRSEGWAAGDSNPEPMD